MEVRAATTDDPDDAEAMTDDLDDAEACISIQDISLAYWYVPECEFSCSGGQYHVFLQALPTSSGTEIR